MKILWIIIFKPLPKKHQLVYIMNSIIILSIITASSDINFSSIKRTKTLLAPCIQRNGANFSGVSIWGTKIKTKKHKIYKGLFTWIPCKTNGYYTNSPWKMQQQQQQLTAKMRCSKTSNLSLVSDFLLFSSNLNKDRSLLQLTTGAMK